MSHPAISSAATLPPPTDAPRPLRRRVIIASLIAMVLAVALVPFTNQTAIPIHRALRAAGIDEFFQTVRQLGGTTLPVSILLGAWWLDPRRRRLVLVTAIAFGLAAAVNLSIKHLAGRARPDSAVLMEGKTITQRLAYIAENPGTPVTADKVDQWMWLKKGRPFLKDDFTSFPSGHSMTAFVFLSFLLWAYPKGRVVWWAYAVGCALSRVFHRQHYIEDVLFGSAVGAIVANWTYSRAWAWNAAAKLQPLFERIPGLGPDPDGAPEAGAGNSSLHKGNSQA